MEWLFKIVQKIAKMQIIKKLPRFFLVKKTKVNYTENLFYGIPQQFFGFFLYMPVAFLNE